MIRFCGGFNHCQNLKWVKTNSACQNNQLNNVNPALPTFNTCHEGLVMSEFDRQFFLAEARLNPGVDQRLAQSLLPFASDCFRHASHTFCDVASGCNLLSKK